jgi:serine protease Do
MVVQVISVEQNGPAARAGIREGDIILSLGEQKVSTIDEVHQILGRRPPGTPVRLKLLRRGRTMELEIVLGEIS